MRQFNESNDEPLGTLAHASAGSVVVVVGGCVVVVGACVVGTVLVELELDDEDEDVEEVEVDDVELDVVGRSVVDVLVVVGMLVLVDVVVVATQLLYWRWSTSMPPEVLESLIAEMPAVFSTP